MMILNQWIDDAWADDSWVPESWGLGLPDEPAVGFDDPGIGLAPQPSVDFVLQPRAWSYEVPKFDETVSRFNVVNIESQRAVKHDHDELKEMMALYSLWRKAA